MTNNQKFMLPRRNLAIVVTILSLSTSCGTRTLRPRPAPTKPPPPTAKRYSPLGFVVDARSVSSAVVLATDSQGTASLIPLPQKPRSVSAAVLGRSGTSPTLGKVTVVTMPRRGAEVPAVRPALTVAATAALWSLNKDLTDYVITSDLALSDEGGDAMMATAVIASVIGADIDESVMIIATVLGDGTLQPVPDVASLIAHTRTRGITRFVLPLGSTAPDKVDAMYAEDLHDAARRVLGKPLPRQALARRADMALDAATKSVLQADYASRRTELSSIWAATIDLESEGGVPEGLRNLARAAERAAARAERFRIAQQPAAANRELVRATALARAALAGKDAFRSLASGETGVAALRNGPSSSADSTMVQLGQAIPTTLGDNLRLLLAFEAAGSQWAWDEHAKAALASLETTAATDGEQALETAVIEIARARANGEAAGGMAHLIARLESTDTQAEYQPSLARLHALGDDYRGVAHAQISRHPSSSPIATHALTLQDEAIALRASWGETSLTWRLFRLALARVAERESEPVDGGDLARTERAARRHAARARAAVGKIPVLARVHYQAAMAIAANDPSSAEVRRMLRASASVSIAAVELARNAALAATNRLSPASPGSPLNTPDSSRPPHPDRED